MGFPLRVAVIPTRDRRWMLFDAVKSLIHQVDKVIIVDNLSDPPISTGVWGLREWWDEEMIDVIRHEEDPPNISRLWNLGLTAAEDLAHEIGIAGWDVAVVNSDVIVPDGWVSGLSTAMRGCGASLASPIQGPWDGPDSIIHRHAGPVPMNQRITGYAHMLRGENGLRYDETMKWWYSDDDMEWQARTLSGAVAVKGFAVKHLEPNLSTNARPELQAQAGRDRQTFINKWGKAPH